MLNPAPVPAVLLKTLTLCRRECADETGGGTSLELRITCRGSGGSELTPPTLMKGSGRSGRRQTRLNASVSSDGLRRCLLRQCIELTQSRARARRRQVFLHKCFLLGLQRLDLFLELELTISEVTHI